MASASSRQFLEHCTAERRKSSTSETYALVAKAAPLAQARRACAAEEEGLDPLDDGVDLRVASHLGVEATVQQINDLVDTLCGHGELRATDHAGAVVRRWSV